MKKTLLFIAAMVFIGFTAKSQTVWDFSTLYPLTSGNTTTAAQGVKDNIGFYVNPTASTPVTTFTIDYSAKTFAAGGSYVGGSLVSRLKLGGKGSDASSANAYLPTTNFVYFNVTGPCTVTVFCRSSTSTADSRILYITDGRNLLGSYVPPTSTFDGAAVVTGAYTGGAGVIYIYGYINAFNIYRVEVTSNVGTTSAIVTAVKPVLADKGVSFNGVEILNDKGLNLEVYNVLGKKVASANTSISTANFQKGIYIVRVSGLNDSLKIVV